MKRVLSLGDIYTTNDNGGDQCGDDSTVFTQVKRRQYKKSKKTGPSTVQTRQATAEAAESTANGEVSDPLVVQLQKTVDELTATMNVQQTTIDNLTRKLNFVLSFLDIRDDTDVERRDGVAASPASSYNVPRSIASGTESSTQQNAPTGHSNASNSVSYSSVTAAGTNDRRNVTYQPVNFREAVAVAMCADRRDKERRAKSIIVSGLAPQQDVTDAASFRQLCSHEFGLDPVVTHTKRLGVPNGDRVQLLLIGLQSSDDVLSIMSYAKLLRRSADESVRSNIFINRNLTKVEARLAYEQRCRRRLRQQVNGSQRPSTRRQDHDRQHVRHQSGLQPMATDQPEDDDHRRSVTDSAAPASVGALPSTSSAATAAAGRHR